MDKTSPGFPLKIVLKIGERGWMSLWHQYYLLLVRTYFVITYICVIFFHSSLQSIPSTTREGSDPWSSSLARRSAIPTQTTPGQDAQYQSRQERHSLPWRWYVRGYRLRSQGYAWPEVRTAGRRVVACFRGLPLHWTVKGMNIKTIW